MKIYIFFFYFERISSVYVYMYFCLKCNFLSSPTSLSLHVSVIYGHHQVFVYLDKTVPLYVKITHRVLNASKNSYTVITNQLHETESVSRTRQLCRYSRTSQNFLELKLSLPCYTRALH
jgi:hypothetical protein